MQTAQSTRTHTPPASPEMIAAHDALKLARAKRESAANALERALRLDALTQQRVAAAEAACQAYETHQQENLAACLADGPGPARFLAAPDQTLAEDLSASRHAAEISKRTVASFQSAHDQAVADVKLCEVARDEAVQACAQTEADAVAARIAKLEVEAYELRTSLLGLSLVLPRKRYPHTTLADPPFVNRSTQAILDPPPMGEELPRYSAELLSCNPHKGRVFAAQAAWEKRLADLKSGDAK